MSDTVSPDILLGLEVFQEEASALLEVGKRLDGEFAAVIEAILNCTGRVVFTGMGKHGLVARKIAATMASTGTPSFFMHPAEGGHGDLGMIERGDVIVAVSNSGNTAEVLNCLPYFKRRGNLVVAMTGNRESELARQADHVLDIAVSREVCPLNLAPTTSTTVAMAMGDALSVVLLKRRGFQPDDFALRHPLGTLGRRLLRVIDVVQGKPNPMIQCSATLGEAITAITAAKRGAVSIVNADGILAGILTDGDLRRIFENAIRQDGLTVSQLYTTCVESLMTRNPMTISPDALAAKAINIMEDGARKIFVLPVVDAAKRPVAMVHLHDLVGAGA